MLSTIHLRTNQILSPGGGRGRKIFFGEGVSNGFQEERGGGISRRQLSITVGLLTIDSQ